MSRPTAANERSLRLARNVVAGRACSKHQGRAALAEILAGEGDSTPTESSLLILRSLAELTDAAGRCPTQEDIAEHAGKSKGTVFYHIAVLTQRRCVKRALSGAGRSRNYKLTIWGRRCLDV